MLKRRVIVLVLAIAVAAPTLYLAQRRMDAARSERFDDELLYLPNEKLLSHFTGGLSSVVADVLWLRCVQYTSKHFRGDHKFVWLAHMGTIITRLDPYFVGVYRYCGIFLAALKADDDASIALMQSGMPPNPDRWELPYEIAMVYLLNRRDQADSPARAADYLAMAVATGQAPETVLAVARGLQMKYNLFDIEEAMWRDRIEHSTDQFVREMAQRQLAELELRRMCALLNEAVGAYKQGQGHAPGQIADLIQAGLIPGTPVDPLGGTFFLDKNGMAQSTTLLDGLVERRLNRLRAEIDTFHQNQGRWPRSLDELVETGAVRAVPDHPYTDRSWQYDPSTGQLR